MGYTAPKKGESDYARTARALNNYASSGDKAAYDSAANYAKTKGWGSMVPTSNPVSSSSKGSSSGGSAVNYSDMSNTDITQAVNDYQKNLGGSPASSTTDQNSKFLRDWAKKNNIDIGYDSSSNKVTIGDHPAVDVNQVPGTTNQNGHLAITDQNAFEDLYMPAVEENPLGVEGSWGKYFDFAKNYIQEPTTTTPDLSTYTKTIQEQLAPVLETQIANLAAERKKAKENTENDLARRGFFGQLPSIEVLNELNSDYDNSEANLRSNFMSNVLGQAFPLYQQSLSQNTADKTAYTQNMLNLGLAVMNGMIDQNKFISDQAYQKAILAQLFGQNVLDATGTIGVTPNI